MIEVVGKIERNLKKLVKKGTFNAEMATGNFNKVLDIKHWQLQSNVDMPVRR